MLRLIDFADISHDPTPAFPSILSKKAYFALPIVNKIKNLKVGAYYRSLHPFIADDTGMIFKVCKSGNKIKFLVQPIYLKDAHEINAYYDFRNQLSA